MKIRSLLLSLLTCCALSLAAFGQQAAPAAADAMPGPSASSAPAVKTVPADRLRAVQELYGLIVEAKTAVDFAARQIVDQQSGCTRQVLDLFGKELSLRVERYNNAVNQMRLDFSVPPGWLFDIERGTFSPPASK
jgi:hypothetical protein